MRKICLFIVFFLSLGVSHPLWASSLRVTHACGGPATALVIGGNYWYQAEGANLHVLHKNKGTLLTTVKLASPATALCTELLLDGNLLYVLLDGKEVLEFDVINPMQPELIRTRTSDVLGILPHSLATVRNEPVVFGEGGVVALRDGKKIITCDCDIASAAKSTTEGIVYVSNRSIVSSKSGETLGRAAQLIELDPTANVDLGTILYLRSIGDETEVGLLAGDLQPIVSTLARVVLEGVPTNILTRGSRVFVTTTTGIHVLGIAPKELRLLRSFAIEGVENIGLLASNYFALSGNFGRGVYRISPDAGGPGETLFRIVPSHGVLGAGVYDVRTLQVPTGRGSILYRFNEGIEYSQDQIEPIEIQTSAIVLGGEARIQSQSGEVVISTDSGNVALALTQPAVTVIALEGNFWFGTQGGVSVCKQTSSGEFIEVDQVQLAGPIVQLISLFDGGVCFVSAAGFVGTLEEVQGEIALEQ
ncbi:MAG: hypothetical protein H8E86_02460 [Planctomycetes bacterium]|nr:hypothetical protein [Planctomycetota bacterium]